MWKTILEFYIKPENLRNVNLAMIDYKNPRLFLPLEELYLGPIIHAEFSTNTFPNSVQNDFKVQCLKFYIELIDQIYKRFPFPSDFVNGIKLIHFIRPPNISKIISLGNLLNSNMLKHFISDIYALDREWRLLRNNDCIIPLLERSAIDFWKKIGTIKNGDNSPAFPNLIKLVSFIFTLPHSSVERIFSSINLNKTKIRNRLNMDALSGILRSKDLLSNQKKCCADFTISSDLINKHNNNMYKRKRQKETERERDSDRERESASDRVSESDSE